MHPSSPTGRRQWRQASETRADHSAGAGNGDARSRRGVRRGAILDALFLKDARYPVAMDLNAFDLLLLILVGLLVLLGLLKGLARLAIGCAALVMAFLLAARFHETAAEAVLGVLDMPEAAANLVGWLGIFLGTMLAGALAARLMRSLLKAAMLGPADRLAGAAAGFVAALLAAGIVILPLVAWVPTGERLLRDSVLAPYVTLFSDLAQAVVPEELGARYRERMDGLRREWSRPPGGADEGAGTDDGAAGRRASE